MKNARLASLILALGLASLIAGCGNKGDLVRPAPKAVAGALR